MKCILYLRKSNEDKKLLSISAQEYELRELAQKMGYEVVGVYSEIRSALHVGRPEFAKLIADMEQGKAEAVLCWKLDRLSRNMADAGVIINHLQNHIIGRIVTCEKAYLPDHPVFEILLGFGLANQYSRDLSANVKRGNREKLRQGGYPGLAPLGYLNITKKDGTNTITIDKKRAPFIREAFEMYASGAYSLKEISDTLYDQGFVSRPGKKTKGLNKIHKSKIAKILENPFYYGLMRHNGDLYPGKHRTIISQNLYDRCQSIRLGKSRQRRQKHFFLFRGLCTCAECGCAITAERQRGHAYYHCTNGKGVCDQKSQFMRGESLEEAVLGKILSGIELSSRMVETMYKIAINNSKEDVENGEKRLTLLEAELSQQEARLSKLMDMFMDGKIDQNMFDQKHLEIENHKKNLLLRVEKLQKKPNYAATIEQTKSCFKAFADTKNRYSLLSDEKKREYLLQLLSNITLKDKEITNFQYHSPFDIIARMPKNADIGIMSRSWDKVRTFFECGGGLSLPDIRLEGDNKSDKMD